MKSLAGFFNKFQGKVASQIQAYDLIIEIIRKHTKVDLEMKDIKISAGELILKTSSMIKNEIYIKKAPILKEIKQKVRGININDIR